MGSGLTMWNDNIVNSPTVGLCNRILLFYSPPFRPFRAILTHGTGYLPTPPPLLVKSRGRSPRCTGVVVYLSWAEGLLRARSNWRHGVAVTLPIIGESNKIKIT